MICINCSKLVFLSTNRNCIRCQNIVFNNLSVLCDFCSTTEKQCAVCLKKILPINKLNKNCGCGKT